MLVGEFRTILCARAVCFVLGRNSALHIYRDATGFPKKKARAQTERPDPGLTAGHRPMPSVLPGGSKSSLPDHGGNRLPPKIAGAALSLHPGVGLATADRSPEYSGHFSLVTVPAVYKVGFSMAAAAVIGRFENVTKRLECPARLENPIFNDQ